MEAEKRILEKLDSIGSEIHSVKLSVAAQEQNMKSLTSMIEELKDDHDGISERLRDVETQQAATVNQVATHDKALWGLFGMASSAVVGVVISLFRSSGQG